MSPEEQAIPPQGDSIGSIEAFQRRALFVASLSTIGMGLVIAPSRLVGIASLNATSAAVLAGWVVFTGGSALTAFLSHRGRYPAALYLAVILTVIADFALVESTVIFLICVTLGLAFVLQVATALETPRNAVAWTVGVAVLYPFLVLGRHQIEPLSIATTTQDWVPLLGGPPLAFLSIGATGLLTLRALSTVLEQVNQRAEALAQTSEQLEHARDEALLASKAKSTFLANMSHELRTPMNAIIGYTELVLDQAPQDFGYRHEIGRVRRAGHQLLHLINEILDLTKVEAGRMELVCSEVDLAEVVADVRSTLEPLLEPGVGLEVDATPTTVVTDEHRLRQILTNIVGNAVKFTKKGRVAIRVERAGAGALVQVRDTGPGIPEQELERLFEPFTQADESTTRVFGGTGLGLAISRRLAHLLGGELDVETEAGVGSTFTLRLPEQPPEPER